MAIVESGFNFDQTPNALEGFNRGAQLSSDAKPEAKPGGITFDWASVDALAKDTYLYDSLADSASDPVGVGSAVHIGDGHAIPAGEKVLPVGSVVIKKSGGAGEYVLCPATIDTAAEVVRGEMFLVTRTILKSDRDSAYPPVMQGGGIWKSFLMVAGANGGATTANAGTAFYGKDVDGGDVSQPAPALVAVEAALPRITYASV
jgi:hypothetical protein